MCVKRSFNQLFLFVIIKDLVDMFTLSYFNQVRGMRNYMYLRIIITCNFDIISYGYPSCLTHPRSINSNEIN